MKYSFLKIQHECHHILGLIKFTETFGDAISQIEDVGNSAGLRTSFLKK